MQLKYYYTDPLKAAWMTREFGMKLYWGEYDADFLGWGVGLIEDCEDIEDFILLTNYRDNKFYIHPDCHETLKPQVGDYIIVKYDQLYDFKLNDSFGVAEEVGSNILLRQDKGLLSLDSEDIEIEIIRRNGRAFFMPEVENAT